MTNEVREALISEIREYLADNIEDYELKCALALRNIEYHYPIPTSLESEIDDRLADWIYENFKAEDFV